MSLLLDTHIAVWTVFSSARLSRAARSILDEAEGDIWVSVVTIWEIAIKHALPGRLDPMPFPGARAVERFRSVGFQFLPVSIAHAATVDRLRPVNKDPFDRLLIAQAKSEPMRFLTADARLTAYGELVVAV